MSRLFMRGLDEQLRSQVKLRLEIRYPLHQAGTPYTVKQLVDTLLYMSDNGAIAMTATGTATVGKTEGVDVRVFAEAVKGFTAAVERYGSQPANATSAPRSVGGLQPSYSRPSVPSGAGQRAPACNFCGGLDHFVCSCPRAEEYVQQGKCTRLEDGRLALPNG